LLLYAVTAVAVKPAGVPEWFRLCPGALAAVISPEEDVADVLLRLPDSWNVVEGARCDDLHDESKCRLSIRVFTAGWCIRVAPSWPTTTAHGSSCSCR